MPDEQNKANQEQEADTPPAPPSASSTKKFTLSTGKPGSGGSRPSLSIGKAAAPGAGLSPVPLSIGTDKIPDPKPFPTNASESAESTPPEIGADSAPPPPAKPQLKMRAAPSPEASSATPPKLSPKNLHPDIQFDEEEAPPAAPASTKPALVALDAAFALIAVVFAGLLIKDLLPHI